MKIKWIKYPTKSLGKGMETMAGKHRT